MDVKAHFESLTRELEALRDRVRNFSVGSPHWLTDGEWKESVLRSVLRGYLPAQIEPARGFVVTRERGTGQIDVLLYDNTKPVLFRNGDLVFVTPDAAVGLVEVKSKITDRHGLREALKSLADDAEIIRACTGDKNLFVGLFAYQTNLEAAHHAEVREDLQAIAQGCRTRVVSYVCLGCSHFTMFWKESPDDGSPLYDHWHSYELHNMAAGYFINNLISMISDNSVDGSPDMWFPAETKELRKLGSDAFEPGASSQRPK